MPFDLERAWEKLHAMTAWIVALFGQPAEIAQRIGLVRKTRGDLLSWLAPLEALARRLLFIEAASLPPGNAPARFAAKGRLASAYRDTQPTELDADSARWRVGFRVPGAPASLRAQRSGAAPQAPSAYGAINNAAPLARRLEALLRLCDDRARVVARLARRLHAQPLETARAFAPYRHRATFCAEAMDEAQAHADHALARYADTS